MNSNPLSQKAIRKAVLTNSLQHPSVLYPAVAGVLAAASSVLFHFGSWPLLLSAAGLVSAFGGWIYQFFGRKDQYSLAYFEEIHARLNREKKQKLTKLRKELRQVDNEAGIKQLDLLEIKYRNFEEILGSKFLQTEMTYSRYLSIAEQVYLATLDNLDKVFLTLKSISAVDTGHLNQRLSELAEQKTDKADNEKQALMRRLTLHQQQRDKADHLILANERALTELDEVTTKIADANINKGRADLDLDQAMEELRHLAERTDQYNRS